MPLADSSPARAAGFYPPTRERPPVRPGPEIGRAYDRAESAAHAVLADTDAQIIRFSELPDSIWLSAARFAAIVTLQDPLGRDPVSFVVPAGVAIETLLRRRVVVARNETAASAALLSVVGKFAVPIDTEEASGHVDPPDDAPADATDGSFYQPTGGFAQQAPAGASGASSPFEPTTGGLQDAAPSFRNMPAPTTPISPPQPAGGTGSPFDSGYGENREIYRPPAHRASPVLGLLSMDHPRAYPAGTTAHPSAVSHAETPAMRLALLARSSPAHRLGR